MINHDNGSRTVLTGSVAVLVVLLWASPGAHAQQTPPEFGGLVEVTRIVTEVRVVDHDGLPVTGLGPDDFKVKVDGRPAVVESASWIPSSDDSALAPGSSPTPSNADGVRLGPEGRLIVLVLQTDFALRPSRTMGLLRIAPYARQFVANLGPRDRVAVLVFGSHLELRADFSDQHLAVAELLTPTEVIEGKLPRVTDDGPSLAAHLDEEEMQQAATMSRAFELIGRALRPIPGTKSLVFFGFALGRMSAGTKITIGDQYRRAMEALTASRASVFSLDISSADAHSLELGMRILSEDTGGFYIKTHIFPEIAVEKLTRVISSYYELAIVPPSDISDRHTIKVKVKRPKTDVYVRQYHPSSYRW